MKNIKIILFILSIMFLINSESISQINWDFSYEDKINVEIYPEKLTNVLEDSIIFIRIFNNSQDTLLTINEIELYGFFSWVLPYPSLSYRIPNIMILYSDDFPVSEGYGKFDVNHYELPKFIVIEPNTEKKIKLNYKKHEKYLKDKTWEFKNFFVFAKKSILDVIVKSNYCYEDYLSSLEYSDTIELKVNDSSGIEDDVKDNFNLIKEAFNIIIIK